ncbi:MAG: trypsin-like peptidase domain-containing protein [Roseobacter sp.]
MRVGPISAAVFALCTVAAPVLAQQQTTGLRGMAAENDALVWQAVGRLDAEGAGFCTGTLIAPELVLTAAHCVYDRKSGRLLAPEAFTFRAGLRNGKTAAARGVVQIEAHPGYDPRAGVVIDNIRHDVALLRLQDPIPTSELDPFVLHSEIVSNGPVSVVSYGRRRENLPSRQDVCQVEMTYEDVMFMDCDVTFGSSGSPVFSHINGRGQIVSVISGMANIDGRKVALGMTLPDIVGQLRHQIWANKERPVAQVKRLTASSGRSSAPRAGGAKFVRP